MQLQKTKRLRPRKAQTPWQKSANKSEAQEKALNSEYSNLMKERGDLDKEKQTAVTPAQIKAYNQRIVDFNTRIQAYEQKAKPIRRSGQIVQ